MIDLSNRQFSDTLDIIEGTRSSLFITGKAGTGKSTFLKHIASTTKKKHVILAPTGIAAINVGGQTLHSFFKIPFYPLLPNDIQYSTRNIRQTLKYNSEKIKLIKELEMIIIDEISMVRADIIDFIDKVLRVYSRNMRQPFGGKQLILFGDIYQLEPVVREDDRRLLQPFYVSQFFFSALVWREMQLVSIELTKVYRQSDLKFISILDRIRDTHATDEDIQLINERVISSDQPLIPKDSNEGSLAITLSTRRDSVDFINQKHLNELEGELVIYHGTIKGDFPETMLPTLTDLELKVGAQIIFIKNDQEKRWVNGTLGIIIGMDESGKTLYIRTENGEEFDVEPAIWSNLRYTFNDKEKKIEEEELGTFTQFPIRLAWAITVHKSQGLTFNNVNIDFSGGAFAGGQTYVALSRCRSLEGITLKEPLRKSDIFVRQEVRNFTRQYNDQNIIQNSLRLSKADVEYKAALSAFERHDFKDAIDHFFIAIHARYDIEKPVQRRFIQQKLFNEYGKIQETINKITEENHQEVIKVRAKLAEEKKKVSKLEKQITEQETFLKELATEYVIMGRECEKEQMTSAAIANYEKAVKLCPDHPDAKKRLKKLKK